MFLTVVLKTFKTTALLIRVLLVHVSRLAAGLHGVNVGDAAASLTLVPFLKSRTFYFHGTTTFYISASGKIDPTCHVPPSSSAVLPVHCSPSLRLFLSRKLLSYCHESGKNSPRAKEEPSIRAMWVN